MKATLAPREEFLIRRLLAALDIDSPSEKQMRVMRRLIEDTGIILPGRVLIDPRLNSQEIACLFWLSRGKKSPQIAHLMELRPQAVRNHLNTLKNKLDAATLAQAVFKALRFQILWPEAGA